MFKKIVGLISVLAAFFSHLTAASPVAIVNLAGASFGNETVATCVSSGKVDEAGRYRLQLVGTCHGTGSLKAVIPNGTKIGSLMDKISPQSSLYLNGVYQSMLLWTGGEVTSYELVNETISGTEDLGLFGNISMSIRIKVRILVDGTAVFSISNSKFKSDYFMGDIVFEQGSKLIVTAPGPATDQVSFSFSGTSLGNKKRSFVKSSGMDRMIPYKRIKYDVSAVCSASGDLKKIIPSKVDFADFLDSLSPSGSDLLAGEHTQSQSTFPMVVCNKKFTGVKKFKGLGKVAISFRQIIKIASDGTASLSIGDFSAVSISGKLNGEISFNKNSRIEMTSVPEFEIELESLKSDESTEVAYVKIRRSGSLKKPASVRVSTTNITAVAGKDYISRNEKIAFASGQSEYIMPIILVNNNRADAGNRRFKVQLTNPSKGSVLGLFSTAVVTINDDEF